MPPTDPAGTTLQVGRGLSTEPGPSPVCTCPEGSSLMPAVKARVTLGPALQFHFLSDPLPPSTANPDF